MQTLEMQCLALGAQQSTQACSHTRQGLMFNMGMPSISFLLLSYKDIGIHKYIYMLYAPVGGSIPAPTRARAHACNAFYSNPQLRLVSLHSVHPSPNPTEDHAAETPLDTLSNFQNAAICAHKETLADLAHAIDIAPFLPARQVRQGLGRGPDAPRRLRHELHVFNDRPIVKVLEA